MSAYFILFHISRWNFCSTNRRICDFGRTGQILFPSRLVLTQLPFDSVNWVFSTGFSLDFYFSFFPFFFHYFLFSFFIVPLLGFFVFFLDVCLFYAASQALSHSWNSTYSLKSTQLHCCNKVSFVWVELDRVCPNFGLFYSALPYFWHLRHGL